MGVKRRPRNVVTRCLAVFLVVSLLFFSLPATPLSALDVYEYFVINYNIIFSSRDITEGQSFSVTVTGHAECIKDLPLEPTEVIITGRVIAEHIESSDTIILNPEYIVTISPFPYNAGETSQSTQSLSLMFPAGSPPGEYTVSGELIQAKLRAGLLFDVTDYLPPTETMGSVSYDIPPPVEPPPITPPDTPDEPDEPSSTPETPDTPEIPSENPQTPEDSDDNISPAFFTISDMAPQPAEINQGEQITFSAKVSNTGGLPGEYEVALVINGTVVETKRLTLENNTSRTVSFTLEDLAPGQYSFSINDLSGSFKVASDATPQPEVPQQEVSETTSETDEGGFQVGTIIYVGDAMLAGIIVWLVLKRRRTI